VNSMWKVLTAVGEWSCSLNGVCCIEHYMEGTDSRLRVLLQLEWNVLQ